MGDRVARGTLRRPQLCSSSARVLDGNAARDGDENPKICLKYGVWQEKSMYGRKYMGVVRTTYLIGPDGKIARRWDKVKVADHAEEVLEAVKAL